MPALQIGGGIILLLFALEMITGKTGSASGGNNKPSLDIAISPLALPLMATPQGNRHGHHAGSCRSKPEE
ncbi:MAG: MarC family protein [Hyphomicrobiales bacterium]